MFGSEREQSDVVAVERVPPPGVRRSRHILFVGVYVVAIGLVCHWFLPTTTLTCRQHASPTASCVVSERMLLGLLPTGTEQIADLRGARTVVRPALERTSEPSYRVVLDTAAGEHEMIWSHSREAADALVRTINERLPTGAPFEASLGFAFYDWGLRALALFVIAGGAAFAGMGLSGLRRAQRAAAQDPH
jgi:hypothetical protein